MAIIFTTGTINQPDSGSVGLAMAEQFRDDLIAHPAWELADEFTAASGLCRWYVFKCLASESGFSSDFYVILSRTLGSGEFRMFICEAYTLGTKTCQYYGTSSPTANVVYDSLGRVPANTYVLGAALLSGPRYIDWTPSGTATKYWITVSEDGFTIAFNGASNGFIHGGGYTYLGSGSNDLPIHIMGASTTGTITRNPSVAGTTPAQSRGLELQGTWPSLGYEGRLDINDRLHDNQRVVCELGLLLGYYYGNGSDHAIQGNFLGKMKRIRRGTNPPTGFAFGDAYVLQNRLWVPYLPSDGKLFDTGVAA